MQYKLSEYIRIYEELKNKMKWKVSDKGILMMIASQYMINRKELRIERLLDIADKLKGNAGMFSSMRSYPRFTTAAMLDVHFDNPEEQVEALFDLYGQMKHAGFKSGTFTYLAATVIITNGANTTNQASIISRSKKIYDLMKKEHMFLTSQDDYPLATLLAYEDGTAEELIERMEMYYNSLHEHQFSKGNELQFLSHILSLGRSENKSSLVNHSVRVYDAFAEVSIKPKKMYYPVIGMLALLPYEELDMAMISHIYQELNREIKWQKDINLIMAVNLFTSEILTHSSLAETSMYTTMETIMQAQQAAMMAAVTATTAAAAASNSGN
ncbi:DUF4003 family protein [Virgibacillus oceani]|uniref:DUF4003 domain-containing protein n=1 Tax=Virgibacillus oceani TaxID=1479511 RepID=A0A917M137_9BACI|nr:DUF4003 family protein [Virgibacillus oceani]GGG71028.1 hypothetical protein GCM10011398_14020 [Virgibacillus oceani]